MTDPTLTITLEEHLDIIEAGELLDYIQTWLAQAPPQITANLEHYAWPSTPPEILQHLSKLGTKLTGQHPPTRPRP